MTKGSYSRRVSAEECRVWRLYLCAVVLLGIISGGESVACEVTDVWLYVGENAAEAATSTRTKQYICDVGTPYGFRIKWMIEGGADEFEVELYDECLRIYHKDEIEGSKDQWVDEITNPAYLTKGLHTLYARVRLWDGDRWTDWESSDVALVCIAADPGAGSAWFLISVDECDQGCTATYWVSDDPGTPLDDIDDSCGNKLTVICFKPPVGGCYYQYWYGTKATPFMVMVGRCPWSDAGNAFCYRATTTLGWGKKRILETKHLSWNDGPEPPARPRRGPDAQGEACTGYFCCRIERYDCVNNTTILVDWLRTPYDWWFPADCDVDEDTWWLWQCPCKPNKHYYCPG